MYSLFTSVILIIFLTSYLNSVIKTTFTRSPSRHKYILTPIRWVFLPPPPLRQTGVDLWCSPSWNRGQPRKVYFIFLFPQIKKQWFFNSDMFAKVEDEDDLLACWIFFVLFSNHGSGCSSPGMISSEILVGIFFIIIFLCGFWVTWCPWIVSREVEVKWLSGSSFDISFECLRNDAIRYTARNRILCDVHPIINLLHNNNNK